MVQIGSDFNEVIDGDVKHRPVINLRKTSCVAIAAKVWMKYSAYSISDLVLSPLNNTQH